MHCTQQIHKPHNSTKSRISIQENVINISVNFGNKTKKNESFRFLFFQQPNRLKPEEKTNNNNPDNKQPIRLKRFDLYTFS